MSSSYSFYGCDIKPNKSNLSNERLILVHTLQGAVHHKRVVIVCKVSISSREKEEEEERGEEGRR